MPCTMCKGEKLVPCPECTDASAFDARAEERQKLREDAHKALDDLLDAILSVKP